MKKRFIKFISTLLSVLLVLSVLVPLISAEDLLSSGEQITYKGHTYIRVDTSMTWSEAKAYCENNGGYLATVTSLAERTVIERLIVNGTKYQYWLGATDEKKEGKWQWVTGETWDDFVPSTCFDNSNGIEDYLQIQRVNEKLSGNGIGVFNDAPNDNTLNRKTDFYSFDHVGFVYEKGSPEDFTQKDYTVNGKTATYNGHTYTLIEESLSWEEAKLAAERKGGYLATVTSKTENEVIMELIQNGTKKDMYWLGGTDAEKEGEWKWITGEVWTFTSENCGLDNTYNDEDYLQIQRNTIEGHGFGYWNDVNNNNSISRLSYFYNSDNVGYIVETGSVQSSFEGLTVTYKGHTYTLVEESLTWQQAEKECERQGGYLATITSEEENDIVKALIQKGSKKDMYWLGGTDKYHEGEWQWVTGEEWIYVPQSIKLDNADGNEDYLQILRKQVEKYTPGDWNDMTENNVYSKEKDIYYPQNIGYIMETGENFNIVAEDTAAEDAPIIYLKGRSNIYNADGKFIFVEDTQDIPGIVMELKDELVEAVKTGDWEPYREKLVEKLEPKFGDYCLNNDGEVDNGSYHPFTWTYQSVSSVQQDIYTYLFEYDCRRDPWEIAEDLHAYISCVKAKTGSNKIHFFSRCLGCNVVSAYLARYGYEDVLSNIFFASAAKGFDYEGEMFSGKFGLEPDAITRYYEDDSDICDRYVREFVTATLQLCNDIGLLDVSTDIGLFLYNQVKDEITPTLMLNTFATCPGYWSMVNDENYEDAKQYLFGDKMYTTYKNLVAKIDRYHYCVMNKLDSTLLNMKNSGVNMYILSKYGFQCSPFIQSSNEMSDDTVDLYSQSFGATCALMNETLTNRYIRTAKKNGTDIYISPDKQIDASTCLFRDSTWFVKNLKHSPFYDCFNTLLQEMCYSEQQFTVFDDSFYPQYLFYNTDNSTCVPLDDSNKTYNDYAQESYFTYLYNYIKSLLDLLKHLYSESSFAMALNGANQAEG